MYEMCLPHSSSWLPPTETLGECIPALAMQKESWMLELQRPGNFVSLLRGGDSHLYWATLNLIPFSLLQGVTASHCQQEALGLQETTATLCSASSPSVNRALSTRRALHFGFFVWIFLWLSFLCSFPGLHNKTSHSTAILDRSLFSHQPSIFCSEFVSPSSQLLISMIKKKQKKPQPRSFKVAE